jgi:hypothetical protein
MHRLLFLSSSARPDGNTVTLARLAAAQIAPDAQVWIDLTAPALPPFCDTRPTGTAPPDGALARIWAAMDWATEIVFVAPVYWYALPAPAKLLLDHWSGWLDTPGLGFADIIKTKRLWLVTARADADPTVADLPEAALRRSADWLGMAWGGAVHGVGDAPGDVLTDAAACAAAARLFAHTPA